MTEDQARVIALSTEATAFLALYDEWKERVEAAKARGVTVDEMKALVASQNNAELNAILFGGEASANAFVLRKQAATTQLIKTYPELATVDTRGGVEACKAADPVLTQRLIEGKEATSTAMAMQQDESTPTCRSYWQQVKLLACAAAAGITCAPGGPASQAFCGWGCWCMLCTENSAVAEIIC